LTFAIMPAMKGKRAAPMLKNADMIAIATKWTSGGRRSFARAKLPGYIGPYTTPRIPVEKAFSKVD